ncbi:MAG: hypothetical protein LBQ90_10550 [Synergistaceae bacterium]|nr:hypothetical protein [Synergistaceae bacterium]
MASTSVAEAADVRRDVERLFELNAKLKPGMPLDALNSLLGPPAGEHQVTGAEDLTRYSWLHGEMGVEIYCVRGVAYRIDIMLPVGNEKDVPRALDALTRQGQARYGVMPSFDRRTGEYYWTGGGVRFGFSKYNSKTVRSTCIALS